MKIYFKHSTRCPISAAAKSEMDRFLENNPGKVEYELIDVISNRPRSNELADQFDIEHESPQIILTDNAGKVLWTASHRRITESSIVNAISQNT